MSSIVPGFNYDIFISYRQKDNKGDKWVSEFVEALKTELESTFKEEISLYIDINPHDGLLETHDVDESLKEKLKCLIFIPIISRTYCDPKSFAWKHEFKAFVEQASGDQFGLKVKLPNGNVASRVLPVRIYDLHPEDIEACETVMGGVLRSIEFIYAEPGVNRPLRANEDNPNDNLNHTTYRNQINKVANSIQDILQGLKHYIQHPGGFPERVAEPAQTPGKNNRKKIIAGSVLLLVLIFLGILSVPGWLKQESSHEKSIAVLPFKLLSNEPDKQYLADGMMEAILLHLSKIRDLRVPGSTSVEQYRETGKTIETIGKELNVDYVLEGNFQKYGDEAKLIVQLIRTKEESHIWSNEYNRNWNDILAVQSEVAKAVASELHAVITPEEKEIIEARPTVDLTAYDLYMRANEYENRSDKEEDFRYALQMHKKAVEIDPEFTLAWIGMAACSRFLYWFCYDLSEENLASAKRYLDKAKALSPGSKEVRFEEAWYYYHCMRDYHRALEQLERLRDDYPNDDYIIASIGFVCRRLGDFKRSLELNEKALSMNSSVWFYWNDAAFTLRSLREYDKAEEYFKRAIDINPSNQEMYLDLPDLYISTGQLQAAREFLAENKEYLEARDLKRYQSRLAFLERKYEPALQFMNSLSDDSISFQNYYYTKHLQLGLIYRAMGDNERAARHFTLERDHLTRKITEADNDYRLYCSLGIACAGLGLREEARRAGERAIDLLGLHKDALVGVFQEIAMVRILVMTEDYDEAMKRLGDVISFHGYITAEELRIDPFWDPVRNHEKFREIVSDPTYQVNL
ncbi:MAG: tetratricopeptide repeat protein [Bacteroidales bacterium]|nr:tetratricopeptide repeat protein [Bacteroidales bacterium]